MLQLSFPVRNFQRGRSLKLSYSKKEKKKRKKMADWLWRTISCVLSWNQREIQVNALEKTLNTS